MENDKNMKNNIDERKERWEKGFLEQLVEKSQGKFFFLGLVALFGFREKVGKYVYKLNRK